MQQRPARSGTTAHRSTRSARGRIGLEGSNGTRPNGALEGDTIDRVYVGRSLQHEVLSGCLGRTDAALYLPDPRGSLSVLNARADEIARASAKRFVDGIVYRITGRPADLYQAVNAFVGLGYERAPAGGRLAIQPPPSEGDLTVQFQKPIRLAPLWSLTPTWMIRTSTDPALLLAMRMLPAGSEPKNGRRS